MLTVNKLVQISHSNSRAAGWWTNLDYEKKMQELADLGLNLYQMKNICEITGLSREKDANVPEKLALIHSEVSEAMEGDRKNLMDDKLPHIPMLHVELADAVIRIADLCGKLEINLEDVILQKLEYNSKREDHKIKNRLLYNGKKY